MHAPNRALEIAPARRLFHAGVCRPGCPYNQEDGWFVPYRRVRSGKSEAVIRLYVKDSSSSFFQALPFVIDTGSDVTIIPRRLLKQRNAFQSNRSLGEWSVEGLTGRTVTGLRFNASMFVVPLTEGPVPLNFGSLKPLVVEDWKSNHGILGLDALRRVLMVSDRDHVSLWPSSVDPCEI